MVWGADTFSSDLTWNGPLQYGLVTYWEQSTFTAYHRNQHSSLPKSRYGKVRNYSHNLTFDYGSRIAVAWLDR